MKQRQHRRTSNKGFALIGSYLALAAVLVYSNLLTMRTMTERRAEQLLQEQLQAFDLAQGALEHLKEKLFEFVREQPSFALPGDVASAYAWIDQLGVGVQTGIYDGLNPLFNPDPDNALALEGVPTSPYPAGPLEVRDLPTLQLTGARAQAWISRVSNIGEDANCNGQLDPGEDQNANAQLDPGGALDPRCVTIEADAQVGATRKRIRASYRMALGNSAVFRYAYFVNNRGWFDTSGAGMFEIRGEVRSNGDLMFNIGTDDSWLFGDLYASDNPEVSSTGQITGWEALEDSYLQGYWRTNPNAARPGNRLVFPGQPTINGQNDPLPAGRGWDPQGDIWSASGTAPDQRRFDEQPVQPMPWIGDLAYYETKAQQQGGTLRYWYEGNDGIWFNGDPSEGYRTLDASYDPAVGRDGAAGTADDGKPLILQGPNGRPIELSGPVVIPGDLIIYGSVTGKGTLYVGRNVHIIGEIIYRRPPILPPLERHETTGQIREQGCDGSCWRPEVDPQNLGYVCADGTYLPPSSGGCP